jgi:hypothetical protein
MHTSIESFTSGTGDRFDYCIESGERLLVDMNSRDWELQGRRWATARGPMAPSIATLEDASRLMALWHQALV